LATELARRRAARSRSRSKTSTERAGSSHKQQLRLRHLHREAHIHLPLRKCFHPITMILTHLPSPLNSSIVTIAVGTAQRLFAAHEDVLCKSPYFAQACREQFFEPTNKRIELPNEEPEVFSAVLEYLYKGDYTPQLAYDKKRTSFYLTKNESHTSTSTMDYQGLTVLKDTVIYVRNPLTYSHQLATDNEDIVRRPPLLPPTPASPCSQETRPPVRRTNQHHPLFCSLRILPHASFRL
jgi:hypothetical protein